MPLGGRGFRPIVCGDVGFARMQANLPLRRSQSDKVVFGVFGGIAQKTGVDANLLRLIWAAVTVGSMGAGLLLYIGAGLLIPPATAMAVASCTGVPQPKRTPSAISCAASCRPRLSCDSGFR